jgi:phosphatidylserine/phosphatidylglycerophosphate/cardiolipin synthase-like enzyme
MISSLGKLPSHIRIRVSEALEAGHLSASSPRGVAIAAVGNGSYAEEVILGLQDLSKLGIEGRAAGAWLRVLDEAIGRPERPDLVWSGPPVQGLHARNTRQVYEELLSSAQSTIWASTFAFYDGPRAFKVLADSMEAKPNLKVRLLVNIQRRRGDTSSGTNVVRRFTEHFWEHEWPGAIRPTVFYDPRSVDPDGPRGVLHAKAVVVDERWTFITSANLTEAALDSNVELGVLFSDRAFGLSVCGYFQGLIDVGLLSVLPED